VTVAREVTCSRSLLILAKNNTEAEIKVENKIVLYSLSFLVSFCD